MNHSERVKLIDVLFRGRTQLITELTDALVDGIAREHARSLAIEFVDKAISLGERVPTVDRMETKP
jgi:hypothetical protein